MPRPRPLTVIDGTYQSSVGAMLLLPHNTPHQKAIAALSTTTRTYGVSGSYNQTSRIVTLVAPPQSQRKIVHVSLQFWSTLGIKDPALVNIDQLMG